MIDRRMIESYNRRNGKPVEYYDYMEERIPNSRNYRGRNDREDFFSMERFSYPQENRNYQNHYDARTAKMIVDSMYHYDNNKRYVGEYYNMNKAEEVYNKHKMTTLRSASIEDVYIAINAAYHDFYGILKTWFGAIPDDKVITLAISFWFEDDDYDGNKLMDYFS